MKYFIKKFIIFVLIFYFFSNISYTVADDFADDFAENDLYDNDIIETSSDFSESSINARSFIVLDRLSKKVLYGKNENNKVKMASTTKIMTAAIIIEHCDLNKTIEVSKKAAGTGGSRLGLKTGDKITVKDLLYGLMLCSGNDAAVALAENCSGSIFEFSNLMNQKAKELSLNNSHFESPHGLDSDNHYTTAYELALLSDYALQNKIFFNIVGTKNYTVTINGYPKSISNTNELLGNLLGIYGIKTGFTNGANRCLVTACKRNDMDIICVVLGCDTKKFRTQDSIKLIEYTFKNFEYVNILEKIIQEFEIWKKENNNQFSVYKGTSNEVSLYLSDLQNPIIPLKKEEISLIAINISSNNYLIAPIKEDTVIGKINVTVNNNNVISLEILNSNIIKKKSFINYILEILSNYSMILNSVISFL